MSLVVIDLTVIKVQAIPRHTTSLMTSLPPIEDNQMLAQQLKDRIWRLQSAKKMNIGHLISSMA